MGTELSCLDDQGAAGQAPSEVVRECPSGTAPDPPIGHATGMLAGWRQGLSTASLSGKLREAFMLLYLGTDLLRAGRIRPLASVAVAAPV